MFSDMSVRSYCGVCYSSSGQTRTKMLSCVRSKDQVLTECIGTHNISRYCTLVKAYVCFFFFRKRLQWARISSFVTVLEHPQRRTTFGRTTLDEWSARRRDLYLTTHNTHNRQTYMPPVGFEPTISAGERPKTNALDRAVTGTGNSLCTTFNFCSLHMLVYMNDYYNFSSHEGTW
jgi:hypothetical protein